MEESPLVSIITITRNRGEIISRAINSVINQSYDNIEYLIVDGNSTDNTEEVVRKFKDDRIKYIRLDENLPIPETINVGFENSKGKYITFLDDDDEYLKCKVEKQVRLFENLSDEYGLVYCWMSYYNSQTGVFLHIHNCKLNGWVGSEVVEKPAVSGTPTFMFRREVYKKMGGWHIQGIISDWELGVRVCQKYAVDYVPESLVNVYINHSKQRMSDWGYYDDEFKKHIIFHEYFLSEYKDIFNSFPSKRWFHLYRLCILYFAIGNFKKGFAYYIQTLKINISKQTVLGVLKGLDLYFLRNEKNK